MNDKIDKEVVRCNAEIQKCHFTHGYKAYLLALAEVDWRAEKRLIEEEAALAF